MIEVTSKGIKKSQNGRCFSCGKQGHLTCIVGKAFLEISQEDLSPLEFVEFVVRVGIGLMNADQQEIFEVISCCGKLPKLLCGLLTGCA